MKNFCKDCEHMIVANPPWLAWLWPPYARHWQREFSRCDKTSSVEAYQDPVTGEYRSHYFKGRYCVNERMWGDCGALGVNFQEKKNE